MNKAFRWNVVRESAIWEHLDVHSSTLTEKKPFKKEVNSKSHWWDNTLEGKLETDVAHVIFVINEHAAQNENLVK
jgi:hypothetical protein